jgi:hypothetical protein
MPELEVRKMLFEHTIEEIVVKDRLLSRLLLVPKPREVLLKSHYGICREQTSERGVRRSGHLGLKQLKFSGLW